MVHFKVEFSNGKKKLGKVTILSSSNLSIAAKIAVGILNRIGPELLFFIPLVSMRGSDVRTRG